MFKKGVLVSVVISISKKILISAHGGDVQRASQDFQYSFDLKIAECYSTSLFNKSHDKKYKIKAIPLKYAIYALV